MSEFKKLRDANMQRQAEWDPSGKISLSFRGNELGGECGEVQNQIKKLERERLGLRGSPGDVNKLREELADAIICIDLIAMEFRLDLWKAIKTKFNDTSRERGLTITLD